MELKLKDIIIIGLLVVLFFTQFNTCNIKESNSSLLNSILRENKTYIKDGLEHTESQVISISKKQFKEIEGLKGELKRLQEIVTQTKRLTDAIVLSNKTKVDIVKQTDSVYFKDTIVSNDTIYLFPEYLYNIDDEWNTGSISASRDSLRLSLLTRNEYEITTQKERLKLNNIFKPRESIVTIVNKNPHTYTTGLQQYKIECNHKPIRNFLIGTGVGFVGGILIKR